MLQPGSSMSSLFTAGGAYVAVRARAAGEAEVLERTRSELSDGALRRDSAREAIGRAHQLVDRAWLARGVACVGHDAQLGLGPGSM
jgi:hypothetical protein